MEIKSQIKIVEDELIQLRRYLHENPEKSQEKHDTQKKIVKYLDGLDVPHIIPIRTDVITIIRDEKSDDHIIGIRAGIDALPMGGLVDCEYKLKASDCAHTYGYDTHITMLLRIAKTLSKVKDELIMTVRLLSQPAEESIENSEAAYMKNKEQILRCDRSIILRIWSRIEADYTSFCYGPAMSAANIFDIYTKGKGRHSILPHRTIGPMVAGAELVDTFQKVVSREVSPLGMAVVSVASFHSGTTPNITPNSAHLMGTCRTFSNELRNHYLDILNSIAQDVTISTRTDIKVEHHRGPSAAINDSECVDTGCRTAARVFDEDRFIDYEQQMGGEDFTEYKNPKYLLMLGGGFSNPEGRFPQHSLYFDIDEDVLKPGVEYFVRCVIEYGLENE